MTTVDDNLLAATLRTAKSGSKAAAKHLDMDAAKQRSAFENAFADAGKKKPTIAIDGKSISTDSTPRANIAIAQKLTASTVKTTASSSDANDIRSTTQVQAKVEVEKRAKIEAESKAEVRADARVEARQKVEDGLEADAEANIDARADMDAEAPSASGVDSAETGAFDDAPIDVKSICADAAKTTEEPSTEVAADDTPVSHGEEAEEEPVSAARSASKSLPMSGDLSVSSALSTLTVLDDVEPQSDSVPDLKAPIDVDPKTARALPVDEFKSKPKISDKLDAQQASALPKLETRKQEPQPTVLPQGSVDASINVIKKTDVSIAQKAADPVVNPTVTPEKAIETKVSGSKTEASKTVEAKVSGVSAAEVNGNSPRADEVKAQDFKPAQPDLAGTLQSTDDTAPVTTAPATQATADVSHLLTLLSPAPQPVAETAVAKSETTPALSEFHALADRAGMAAPAPRDRAETKSETKDDAAPVSDKIAVGSEKAAASPDASTANKTVSADTDQIFRFARSDGKGQTVSMNVVADGDKTAVKNDIPAVSAKAETVTVLEARRYLGLAPSSNAAAVTSQIVSNPEWAKTLQPADVGATSSAQASTGKVLNTLRIQMHPIDLGTVTATLRLKEDELHVELKVETGGAFRQLSDDQNDIVKALRSQGFAVDQVSIVFNAPDSSGSTTQQQAQPQAAQQGREALADGSPQGRGQRNDNGSQQQSSGRWTGNEGTSDPSYGADASRTGDVYI